MKNFTIMFLLYYGKAIKRESGKVEKAWKIVGNLGVAPLASPIFFFIHFVI
jgi:hypothetical protein